MGLIVTDCEDQRPAIPDEIANVLETFGIRQGVDVREWLRCVLPSALSLSIRGQDVSPPQECSINKNSANASATTHAIDGVAVPAGEVHIIRTMHFEEDATSAADSLEVARIGGSTAIDPMMERLAPFPTQFIIGDDSNFTVAVAAMLPVAMYEGQRFRIRLRRAALGPLGGTLRQIIEKYSPPWRPVGF